MFKPYPNPFTLESARVYFESHSKEEQLSMPDSFYVLCSLEADKSLAEFYYETDVICGRIA